MSRWTPLERDKANQMIIDGDYTDSEIAEMMGRSTHAITQYRIKRLGMRRPPHPQTQLHKAKVRRSIEQGQYSADMALHLLRAIACAEGEVSLAKAGKLAGLGATTVYDILTGKRLHVRRGTMALLCKAVQLTARQGRGERND